MFHPLLKIAACRLFLGGDFLATIQLDPEFQNVFQNVNFHVVHKYSRFCQKGRIGNLKVDQNPLGSNTGFEPGVVRTLTRFKLPKQREESTLGHTPPRRRQGLRVAVLRCSFGRSVRGGEIAAEGVDARIEDVQDFSSMV